MNTPTRVYLTAVMFLKFSALPWSLTRSERGFKSYGSCIREGFLYWVSVVIYLKQVLCLGHAGVGVYVSIQKFF